MRLALLHAFMVHVVWDTCMGAHRRIQAVTHPPAPDITAIQVPSWRLR